MAMNIRRRGPKAQKLPSPDIAKDDHDRNTAADKTLDICHASKAGWSPNPTDNVRTHPASHGSTRGKKRRHTFIFFLGSLFGLVAAGFFAKSNDLIDFPEIGDLKMDSFLDVLPAGLVTDMRDLVVSMSLQPPLQARDILIQSANNTNSTHVLERRTRLAGQLRCILGWPQSQIGRSRRQSLSHHDTWCYFHRPRVLGNCELLPAIFQEEALG